MFFHRLIWSHMLSPDLSRFSSLPHHTYSDYQIHLVKLSYPFTLDSFHRQAVHFHADPLLTSKGCFVSQLLMWCPSFKTLSNKDLKKHRSWELSVSSPSLLRKGKKSTIKPSSAFTQGFFSLTVGLLARLHAVKVTASAWKTKPTAARWGLSPGATCTVTLALMLDLLWSRLFPVSHTAAARQPFRGDLAASARSRTTRQTPSVVFVFPVSLHTSPRASGDNPRAERASPRHAVGHPTRARSSAKLNTSTYLTPSQKAFYLFRDASSIKKKKKELN